MRWTRAALKTRAPTCGRQSRVVLTPRRRRQVDGGNSVGDGDNKPDHRGERGVTVKTIARGMPGETGVTVVTTLACLFYFTCEAAGASSARHSLRPRFFQGETFTHSSGAMRGGNAEVCLEREHCHCEEQGDEAIHLSVLLSRAWIASLALAMTAELARGTLTRHHPRMRVIQYSRDADDGVEKPRRTGYPACAGYDDRVWSNDRATLCVRANADVCLTVPHIVVPAHAGTHNPERSLLDQGNCPWAQTKGRGVWVPAFAGTTDERAFAENDDDSRFRERSSPSRLARGKIRHLDRAAAMR